MLVRHHAQSLAPIRGGLVPGSRREAEVDVAASEQGPGRIAAMHLARRSRLEMIANINGAIKLSNPGRCASRAAVREYRQATRDLPFSKKGWWANGQ